MVIQGHDTTVPVTVDDIDLSLPVPWRAALRRAFLIADMPFMSYTTLAQALDNAVRLMQEGGAKMVKLEERAGPGRDRRASRAPRHSGVRAPRPQAAVGAQDRRLQACRAASRRRPRRCIDDARALEAAGADIVLLECVPNAAWASDHARPATCR